jgi:outer membrane protein OmpA-like peptidoglycan-associated protein
MMIRNIYKFKNASMRQLMVMGVVLSSLLIACSSDPLSPGIEYMPDMYRTPAIEAYSTDSVSVNGQLVGMSARKPVRGTIARGYDIYPYKNTAEDYERAGIELKNPLVCSPEVMVKGKRLYNNFCTHCHGAAGAGDGQVAKSPKWPGPPPAYNGPALKDLPEGKIFHTLTYGKGNMGSHASQLTAEERWTLVHYVEKLQGKGKDCSGDIDYSKMDTDGDNVSDLVDQCPKTPGLASNFGCPEVSDDVNEALKHAIEGLLFETGSSKISEESFDVLMEVVEVLNNNRTYNLNVNGHTDNSGKHDMNMNLSKERSNAVKSFLASKGIDGSRVFAYGYGEMKPLASNNTEEGKKKNRRVEFRIVY